MKKVKKETDMTATIIKSTQDQDLVDDILVQEEVNPDSLEAKVVNVPDKYKSTYELAYTTAQVQAMKEFGYIDDENNPVVLRIAATNADKKLRDWEIEELQKQKAQLQKASTSKPSRTRAGSFTAVFRSLRSALAQIVKRFEPGYKESLLSASNMVTRYRFLVMAILMKTELAREILSTPLLDDADLLEDRYGDVVTSNFKNNPDIVEYITQQKTIEEIAEEWTSKITDEDLYQLMAELILYSPQPNKIGRGKKKDADEVVAEDVDIA